MGLVRFPGPINSMFQTFSIRHLKEPQNLDELPQVQCLRTFKGHPAIQTCLDVGISNIYFWGIEIGVKVCFLQLVGHI